MEGHTPTVTTQRWTVRAQEVPTIPRHCPGCGRRTRFRSTERFRVNAQGRRLDVWLIYACTRCGERWNREVISRRRPEDIPDEMLRGFHENDAQRARAFALDDVGLSERGLRLERSGAFVIEGAEGRGEGALMIEVHLIDSISVRLDRLLSEGLDAPRSRITALFGCGQITIEPGRARALRRPSQDGQRIYVLSS